MNKLLQGFSKQHRPDIEALSAHLDGRLDAAQAQAIKAHVAACDVCRPALAQMQNLQAMLQAMPEVEAPRSFRLRQADVETPIPERSSPGAGSTAMRWAPALGGMAAALFVVVLGADLVTRGGAADRQLAASRETSQPTGSLAAEADAGFDDSAPKTQGDVASAPPVATTVEAATRADEFVTTPAPNAAGAAETAIEPTGVPADGDVEILVPNTGPGPGGPIPADEGLTGDNVPPEVGVDAVTAVAATVQVEATPPPSPVGELSAAASDSVEDDGEGNRSAYLIVEIVTAALAVGVGAALVFWRIRRRGAA